MEKTYFVTIIVNGTDREYKGTYDEMHNVDWNEKVRDLLDNQK